MTKLYISLNCVNYSSDSTLLHTLFVRNPAEPCKHQQSNYDKFSCTFSKVYRRPNSGVRGIKQSSYQRSKQQRYNIDK